MKRVLVVALSMALLLPMIVTETLAVSDLTASPNLPMSIAEFTNTYAGATISTESSSSVDAQDVGTTLNIVCRRFDYHTGDCSNRYSETYDVTEHYHCTEERT